MTSTAQAHCPFRIDATGSDIHAEGAALRAIGPAARVVLPGLPDDIVTWSVTDPDLIRRLLAHPDISKNAGEHWPALKTGQVPDDWPEQIWVIVRNALGAYGVEHRRLRRPLAAAFSPRRVRALTPQIEALTQELLDELEDEGADGTVDLRDRFTARLPLRVVNLVLGVPEEMHDKFRGPVGDLFTTTLTSEEAGAVRDRVYKLLGELVKHKQKHPGGDITTSLIDSHRDGELTLQELLDSLMLLIGAGHETTVGLLSHGVVNLAVHRDQLALATSGEVPWSTVVDEVLRHQAPIATILPRFPVCQVTDEITGITFAPGDLIVINYAAAGRDTGVHGATADRFDVTRPRHDHLAFGHGVHMCPGAELARIEGRVALAALFERFPDLHLAVEPSRLEPLPSYISNGFTAIPTHLGQAHVRAGEDR
ncbi:cytochrome P450 [Streptomyces sp. NPDC050204]|uniref:cytochrome P450 family protein n=1 Tax=Streptomyces sp. NPDC050204 TaxID=3155514 RepID=UPI003439A150